MVEYGCCVWCSPAEGAVGLDKSNNTPAGAQE